MNENSLEQLNEAELELVDLSSIELKLQNDLDVSLKEFEFLEEEKKKIGNPDALGNVVFDEITNQLGRQLGLKLTNETLIQKYNEKHPESYNKVKDVVMQDKAYKDVNKGFKQQQKEGKLVDSYTGKKLKQNDSMNLDHVVPRKEIFDNERRKQANLATEDLANKQENLKPTNEALNKSKKDKSVSKYVETREIREKDLIAQNERANEKIRNSNLSETEKRLQIEKNNKQLKDKLDAKDDLMRKADDNARKAINRDIVKGVAKETVKKAGSDFLKTILSIALVDLLREIVKALIAFFKNAVKSLKSFLYEMKNALTNFVVTIKEKVKSVLGIGITNSVGTIVAEIFGPIVSTFKKLASVIKLGISSFVDAIKWLTNPENKNKPFEIKIAQVGKIVVGTLVTAGALFSGEFFASLLKPLKVVNIPLLGSLDMIIGLFLASLLSGIIGAIVLNAIDKYIADKINSDNKKRQVKLNTEILNKQNIIEKVVTKELDYTKKYVARNITESNKEAENLIKIGAKEIFNNPSVNNVRKEKLNNIQNIQNELDKKLKDIQGA